jgi:uncharacterized phage protein gp47/JayE
MTSPPPIDYTNLGYESLRDTMLALARRNLPEWTDLSENDLGVLLIELFAYAADITLYYQTRIAGNLFPETADEPDALLQLLRLIGYELRPPAPATADLSVTFTAAAGTPILLPAGTPFSTRLLSGETLVFETVRDTRIGAALQPDARGLRTYYPVTVAEGRSVPAERVGDGDGSPGQLFVLRGRPVIDGSVTVEVTEAGGRTRWRRVETLAHSTPADRDFVVRRDIAGGATVTFGDGSYGRTPQGPVDVAYRTGGGPAGNLPANTRFTSTAAGVQGAVNPYPAAGGAPAEDAWTAVRLAPRLYRTQERAVTVEDYVDLALQVPGVGKARVVAANWNDVVLYIAPSGQVAQPSELLRRQVLAHLERRRMLTTTIRLVGPSPADVYLGARIRAHPYFLNSEVREAVENAVAGYLAYEAIDFGVEIYLSRIYELIQDLEQVASLTVFKFSRDPALPADIETHPDVLPQGVFRLEPDELPRPGYRDDAADPPRLADRPPIYTIIEGGVVPSPQ